MHDKKSQLLPSIARPGSRLTRTLVVALLVLATGCTDQKEPSCSLSGTVVADGSPIGDCKIGVYNLTSKKTKGTIVDGQGQFTFEELPLGEYEVMILLKPSNSPKDVIDERIPQKFRDRKTSGITVSVVEGENKLDVDMSK